MNTREHFEKWYYASKYNQVVFASAYSYQIAFDGWAECAKHYEAEIEQLQADNARLIEASAWLIECMEDINDDISAKDLTNAVIDLGELLTQMKGK